MNTRSSLDSSRRGRTNSAGGEQRPQVLARRLLETLVYQLSRRAGGSVRIDDLVDTTEIGDWKMPEFKTCCAYAVSQGWLIVEEDSLILTNAGTAAA
jgi:hypothetical protein